jgi:SpoVK/Ycf46/Vps4 family AAA+-type ATPase
LSLNSYSLIEKCLSKFPEIKRELVRTHLASVFELEFEICYALFVASRSDGQLTPEKKRLVSFVYKTLDWSKSYARILEDRIKHLPKYDFNDFKIGKKSLEFGTLLYELFYIIVHNSDAHHYECQSLTNQLADSLFQSGHTGMLSKINDQLGQYLRKNEKLTIQAQKSVDKAVDQEKEQNTVDLKLEDCLNELEKLIGLESVKDKVKELIHLLEIQTHRKRHQMQSPEMSLHMVFSGNPGTGKTTVSRILANIFKAMGILKKGHLVETDRSGLVGQYIGHTEKKTNEVVDQALDGILFIDEAYALFRESSGNDFGKEAIDTLVKRIEDDRGRLVVIAAGYEEEMNGFIAANPGLKSRFNTFIHFPDYNCEELIQIFTLLCKSNDYRLTKGAKEKLTHQIAKDLEKKEPGFGNGRYVRNLFEKAVRNQAVRLNTLKGSLSKQKLATFTIADIS